jgi:hypothetical protein
MLNFYDNLKLTLVNQQRGEMNMILYLRMKKSKLTKGFNFISGKIHLPPGKRLILTALFLTSAFLLSSCGPSGTTTTDPSTRTETTIANNYVQLGAEQVVLASSNRFGIQWFPDTVSTVIPTGDYPFRILLTAGEMGSYLLEGSDLFHLTKCVGPILEKGGAGTIDNGYAGISGAVAYGNTIFAIYHTEDHENMPSLGGGVSGYYSTVSLAKSTDNGHSFSKLGQIIASQKGKDYNNGQADRGAGEPCMVETQDGNLYIYYVDHSRVNGRGCQIFLARCPKPSNPNGLSDFTFTKYYNGDFSQSGIIDATNPWSTGGLDTPVLSGQIINSADATFPSVYYSKGLGKYIMVLNLVVWKEWQSSGSQPNLNGIYYATSTNGIQWSAPVQIIRDWSLAYGTNEFIWHPSIVWDSDDHLSGYLVYSKGNQNTTHYMVCRRIQLLQ